MTDEQDFNIIFGPCAIENLRQLEHFFKTFPDLELFRGGLYKMRTSKADFQGLRGDGVDLLMNAKKRYGFKFVSEVVDFESLAVLEGVIDVIQVGARNMYNYELLRAVGKLEKPVLLKRAFSATLKEFINAAEYISLPPEKITLCERGIRSFEPSYRNVVDINAVIFLKQRTQYKVFVDPSHGSGAREMVSPLSRAALAAGADGLLIEVHPDPQSALSDGPQALALSDMHQLINDLEKLCPVFGRKLKWSQKSKE